MPNVMCPYTWVLRASLCHFARIVKGLIALLLTVTHGQDKASIAALDLNAYFEQLGLSGQLSPSRTNGVLALAQAIKAAAN